MTDIKKLIPSRKDNRCIIDETHICNYCGDCLITPCNVKECIFNNEICITKHIIDKFGRCITCRIDKSKIKSR